MGADAEQFKTFLEELAHTSGLAGIKVRHTLRLSINSQSSYQTLTIRHLPYIPTHTQTHSNTLKHTQTHSNALKHIQEAQGFALAKSVEQLRQLLGCTQVEFRCGWSHANNVVMLRRLTSTLAQSQAAGRLLLPWAGLRLVFTQDDCSHQPVDAVEAAVHLSPTDVPIQWERVVQVRSQDHLKFLLVFFLQALHCTPRTGFSLFFSPSRSHSRVYSQKYSTEQSQ